MEEEKNSNCVVISQETNDYWTWDNTIIFKPSFNESLYRYYKTIEKFSKLIFGNHYDMKKCISNNNKNGLSTFNNIVSGIPSSITHLVFGYEFNQVVWNLPTKLTRLEFGFKFNQQVSRLPLTLTYLKFL